MRKYSRQREAILQYLMERHDHPTAEMVFQAVRQVHPKVSLGTVYRNLTLLESDGTISRINCGDGVEHYDARTEPHYHYHCRQCGILKDIPLSYLPDLEKISEEASGDAIDGCSILFYGLCGNCQKHLDSAKIV